MTQEKSEKLKSFYIGNFGWEELKEFVDCHEGREIFTVRANGSFFLYGVDQSELPNSFLVSKPGLGNLDFNVMRIGDYESVETPDGLEVRAEYMVEETELV